MMPLWIPLMLTVLGMLIAIFAQPIGNFNAWIVPHLPAAGQKFYAMTSLGRPFDSSVWVAYNRLGGIIVAVGGAVMLYFQHR